MTTDLPTLPDMGVLYRCHVVAQILQGFSGGVDGERLTAALDWALQGKADLGATQTLTRLFAAPHVAALEEGAWQGDPLAAAARDIMAAEAAAAILVNVNASPHRAAAEAVIAERIRQVSEEDCDPEDDDDYRLGELALAAAAYAVHSAACTDGSGALARRALDLWPWNHGWYRPKGAQRDLERAGALILAELERRQRAEAAKAGAAQS